MSFNFAGFLRGAGQGVAQVGQQRAVEEANARSQQAAQAGQARQIQLTEEVQLRRDARLAQIEQQKSQAAAQIAQQEAADAERVRLQEREWELADQATERDFETQAATIGHGRDVELAKIDPRATQVTVNNQSGDSDARTKKFGEALGANDAELASKIDNEYLASAKIEDSVNIIEGILNEGDTGQKAELLARAGRVFGTEAATRLDTFEAAVAPLVLAQAESLAGVLSDSDIKLLERSVTNFGKTTDANRNTIRLLRIGIDRQRENKAALDKWLETNSNLYGFTPPNSQGTERVGANDDSANAVGSSGFSGTPDDPLGLL